MTNETEKNEENIAEEAKQEAIEDIAREEKLSELDILKQSVEEKQKLADEYYDQLLRLKADFENFRKRAEKEKQDFLNWGREKILLKQISIYDVFQHAMQSVRSGQNLESIRVGLEMINCEFEKMLKEEGVEKIDCMDKQFDPNFCEALEQVESEDKEGKILGVYQQGYKLNGKLMRPARVKVAKCKEKAKEEQEEQQENTEK